MPSDLIIVGTASAFRPLTGGNADEIYAEYIAFAERLHVDRSAAYSQEEFVLAFAGWTRIKVFNIPLVYGEYEYALVPNGLHETIRFPSGFGTFLAQESGDLLAARTNVDGYYIVTEILCKDEAGYSACADGYQKGLFDGFTGEELDPRNLTPKDSQKRIDPISYKRAAP